MRDEERIDLYYKSGVLDWRSEEAEQARKLEEKKTTGRPTPGSSKILTPMGRVWNFILYMFKLKRRQTL